jgi:hypothetical protein
MPAQLSQYAALAWRKSTFSSGGGDCVEIAPDALSVLVRDSRNRSGAVLAMSPSQWSAFLRRIRNEEQPS